MVNLYHSDLLNPLIGFTGEATALIKRKGSLTIADLFQKSKQLTVGLNRKGFRANDIVLVTLPPGEAFLVVIYAVAMLRGRVAIIDPEMGRIHFEAKLKQLAPKWAFIDSRLLLLREHPFLHFLLYKMKRHLPSIPTIDNCTVISTGRRMPTMRKYLQFSDLLSAHDEVQFVPFDQVHEFLIVYTSGTVQAPKGVLHSFQSLTRSIANLVKLIEEKPGDRLGTELPHYMLLGIAAGIPAYIFTTAVSNPGSRIREIEEMRITLMFCPPSEFLPLVSHCEKEKRKLPSSLRRVFFGSAPVHTSFLRRFFAVADPGLDAVCLYGMTELLVCAFIRGREKLEGKNMEGDLLGQVWPDVECKIHDDGEIMLKSPQLFERYLHEDGRKEFHSSGDTGYLDESNNLVLTGRKKDMIIRKNFNIYPAIYETIIRNNEGVLDCALVGVYNNAIEDEEVYLVIEGTGVRIQKIRQNLEYGSLAIPREAWPDKIVQMEVPRNGRHRKIDKDKLRNLLRQFS